MENMPISSDQLSLAREANRAFGLDPVYAIEFAREAGRIRDKAAQASHPVKADRDKSFKALLAREQAERESGLV